MHGDDYDATNDKNGSIDEEDVIMGCDNDETNEVDRADDDDDMAWGVQLRQSHFCNFCVSKPLNTLSSTMTMMMAMKTMTTNNDDDDLINFESESRCVCIEWKRDRFILPLI